jgi:hypothetical protein
MVNSRNVFVMRDGAGRVVEFMVFDAGEDCCYLKFYLGSEILLRVSMFSAASMLLM